jgi:hypothetical protein
MAIHSPEFLKRRRDQYKQRIIWTSLVLTILVGTSIYISHLERFLISEVEVVGNSVTADSEIREVVQRVMSGKYFWLYPRSNELMFPRGEIRQELSANVLRLKSVELSSSKSGKLLVSVEERTPHGLYCEDISDISNPRSCYFVDEGGFIFSTAPSFSGEVYFLYSAREPVEGPLGTQYIARDSFRSLSFYIESLRKLNVEPRAVEINTRTGEYNLILQNEGRIVWKITQDLDRIAQNLEAFLLDDEVVAQRNFLNRVLYIDMRYENKVFYKFQD